MTTLGSFFRSIRPQRIAPYEKELIYIVSNNKLILTAPHWGYHATMKITRDGYIDRHIRKHGPKKAYRPLGIVNLGLAIKRGTERLKSCFSKKDFIFPLEKAKRNQWKIYSITSPEIPKKKKIKISDFLKTRIRKRRMRLSEAHKYETIVVYSKNGKFRGFLGKDGKYFISNIFLNKIRKVFDEEFRTVMMEKKHYIPSEKEFIEGIKEFEELEDRDAMYKVASFLVSHFWGKPSDMADGLGVLLLTWNQAFYRYGRFDFEKLERCISKNLPELKRFRRRDISSFTDKDEKDTISLFDELLDALQIISGKKRGNKSPVATAKALHLLAPNFFPLWDERIAKAYDCYYGKEPAEKYVKFCGIMKTMTSATKEYNIRKTESRLKLIDEYNYARYSKGWI